MRILYVAPKYDYGNPAQGHSYEHNNFFDCLHRSGHDVIYFDFMSIMQRHGRAAMNNQKLKEVANTEKPTLLLSVIYFDELDESIIRKISDGGVTTTLNWFCDDHARFEALSRRWAPCFNWVVTTANDALPKYAKLRYQNVIKSQWGYNPFCYRKISEEMKFDVTFVGQAHSRRPLMIEALRRNGVDVRVWGRGWNQGRLDHGQMIEVFSTSRINLNFVDFSDPLLSWRLRAEHAVRRWGGKVRHAVGLQRRRGNTTEAREILPEAQGGVVPPLEALDTAGTGLKYSAQIKGRNFEVPGCGGFLLTGSAENIDEYYKPGEEIALYDNVEELVEQVRFYLANDAKRDAIARAGYERTRKDHSYLTRFENIFSKMGLREVVHGHWPATAVREGELLEIN